MSEDVFTIDEFCFSHKICRATFYNLQKKQQAPAVMRVGKRILISKEAAAGWRRKMESQTSQPAAA